MYTAVIQRNQTPGKAVFVTSSHGGEPNRPSNILKSSVLKSFLAGSTSGTITCILFQPFDLVKTRLQVPGLLLHFGADKSCDVGIVRRNYILWTVNNVIRNDSFAGLWQGLSPSLYRTVPGIGMYFCSLHCMKNSFKTKPTFYQNMVLGFTARSLVGTAMLPITVIKTRYESGSFHYKTVPQALRIIWQGEGMKGLFSGWSATIARDAPYSGLYYMFYSQLKVALSSNMEHDLDAYNHFGCGLIAGILACVVTQPADVVKTHMQLYPSLYRNTINCFATILKEHGVGGLARGMLPRCLRKTLISALSWTVFEEIMKIKVS